MTKKKNVGIPESSTGHDIACSICDGTLIFIPSDTPTIFRCELCGAPSRDIVGAAPICLFKKDWIAATRAYWEAEHRNVAPGYGMAVKSTSDEADRYALNAWLAANANSLPSEYREWPRDHDGRLETI